MRLEDVPETGLHFDLVADGAIRDGAAAAAGVDAVARLTATFDVTRRGDGLRVRGHVSADVRQICVVTLEPLMNHVEEDVDLVFAPENVPEGSPEGGVEDGGEPPEALVSGTADLGAVATESLLLGIDPYPRKPGAVFAPASTGEEASHPFAALAALKKEQEEGVH